MVRLRLLSVEIEICVKAKNGKEKVKIPRYSLPTSMTFVSFVKNDKTVFGKIRQERKSKRAKVRPEIIPICDMFLTAEKSFLPKFFEARMSTVASIPPMRI